MLRDFAWRSSGEEIAAVVDADSSARRPGFSARLLTIDARATNPQTPFHTGSRGT
jgi:hypothetical protein